MTCVDCPGTATNAVTRESPDPAVEHAVDAGVAGASARRIYEHRRQKREEIARERLGKVGVVLARVTSEPQHAAAWQKGSKGEAHVAKRLEKHLTGTGVRLLHDRRTPDRRANIDHIVIGPGGVTVIDTKNYKGKVRVKQVGGLFEKRRTILEIGGRDQTRLVKAVATQAQLVRGLLTDTAFAEVDIEAALCMADVDGLPLFSHPELRDVTIDGARRVAKVAARPGDLTADAIDQLWELVGRRLPPA